MAAAAALLARAAEAARRQATVAAAKAAGGRLGRRRGDDGNRHIAIGRAAVAGDVERHGIGSGPRAGVGDGPLTVARAAGGAEWVAEHGRERPKRRVGGDQRQRGRGALIDRGGGGGQRRRRTRLDGEKRDGFRARPAGVDRAAGVEARLDRRHGRAAGGRQIGADLVDGHRGLHIRGLPGENHRLAGTNRRPGQREGQRRCCARLGRSDRPPAPDGRIVLRDGKEEKESDEDCQPAGDHASRDTIRLHLCCFHATSARSANGGAAGAPMRATCAQSEAPR